MVNYSGLNLNRYGVASPCRTICTVCGFVALSGFLLIHYNKQYALTGKTSPNFIKKSTVPVFFRRH
ncbi:TPA: hypothetical protein ACFK3Y_02410 [Neisseria gonorrhoeae]